MEQNWERTVPFLKINRECVYKLFKGILDRDEIIDIKTIDEGCRTTNYIVESKYNQAKYILKIFNTDEQDYKKEIKLLNILKNEVPVQRLYKFDSDEIIDNKYYGIYEYIDGRTIGQVLSDGCVMNEEMVVSAAKLLAKIHKHKFDRVGFLDENLDVYNKLRPINLWYEDFINENVKKRLDEETINKIKNIVKKNTDILLELDKDSRLVHGDFQGTNILVKDSRVCGILDWEFSMAGHPLGDIGQFFRYDEYISENLIRKFEEVYRRESDYVLMKEWYKISKLRDLASLIQLMGKEEEMPTKYKDIRSIIERTLNLFQKQS